MPVVFIKPLKKLSSI